MTDSDILLTGFLRAATEHEAQQELAQLTEKTILPVCRLVLNHHLVQGQEGLLQGALDAVGKHLLLWRSQQGEPPISDLEEYVSAVTRNTLEAHQRTQNPEWLLLRSQIRYRFHNDPSLATWEQSEQRVCGIAEWQGARSPHRLPDGLTKEERSLPLPTLCLSLLERAGGPVLLDELARQVGLCEGIVTQAREPLSVVPEAPISQTEGIQEHPFLAALWTELRLLPRRQATVLLLTLRDSSGCGVIELLQTHGLASPEQLTQVLGWSSVQADALWEQLPRDDHELALLLGIIVAQVRSLRKVAWERLERRLNRLAAEGA